MAKIGNRAFSKSADSRPDSLRNPFSLWSVVFNVPNPSDETEGDFKSNLNPESLIGLKNCRIEGGLKGTKPGDVYQFMRKGYYCVDINSTDENVVFNLTVALNSSWK